jgi:hypothetical protein
VPMKKVNIVLWSDETPHATVQSNFQLRCSVKVWCAVLDDRVISPFIFDCRLTGEVYLRFLREEQAKLLEYMPLNKQGHMYFQHDGSTPHFSRTVRNFLNDHSRGRWIGRRAPHNWPGRSPDLSLLDFCV